jgi:hypothetical protein
MEIQSVDAANNTNQFNQIALINTDKSKKKPYDVKIKNYNPNEPKIKANMKYSDKHRFRKYKTKTEPKLYSKIMVDDEEELISKIRKEFGIKDTTRKNYSEVETSGTPYYKAPNPQLPERQSMVRFDDDELSDMTRKDIEDILGGIISQITRDEDAKAVGLTLASGEDMGDIDDEDLLPADDDDEPLPLMREASRGTELSALTTKAEEIETLNYDDLVTELNKRGLTRKSGQPPTNPATIKRHETEMRKKIMEFDKNRGASP